MIDLERLLGLIAGGETVECEFKSDRKQISDNDIYETVVALANTSGGALLIGVEDDGAVTGAKPRHGKTSNPIKLQAAILNNTVPNINPRVSLVPHPDGPVLAIEVDPYPEPCSTASGKSLRRVIGPDGKPQTVPFYASEQRSRLTDLGLLDFSAQVMEQASFDDLDPLEFERLRQAITRLRGDRSLLELSDRDVVKALRLAETRASKLIPNIAGLLLLAREETIRRIVPTHGVHYQVLDDQGNVKVNDEFHGPLLQVLQEVESRFAARNEEREVNIGLFRVPVPDYSPEGFREAVNNAVLHRDYTRLDAVYVQCQPDHMLITSPGGFPEGINVDNILVHEPKPRNPRLAEAFKRIGLVEQTGRGVDKIFLGQVRYGRPAPDYSRSDNTGVRIILRGGKPSLEFAAFVYEQDKAGTPLSLDELLILNTLFLERRTNAQAAQRLVQKGPTETRAILERLHERGLVEARGEKRGRVYHLSASLYRKLGEGAAYIRTRGFDRIQQRQMVLSAIESDPDHRITRAKAAELCRLSGDQASRLLRNMRDDNTLEQLGKGRGSCYGLKRAEKTRAGE